MSKIKAHKFYFLVILIFLSYLITLPYLNELLTPCLRPNPDTSYTDATCNLNLALDRYLLMAMIGFIICCLVFYVLGKRKAYFQFTTAAVLIAMLVFIGFNLYIKTAESQIKHAPIILESITH